MAGSPPAEVEWIRSGQPVDFESESWFPQDSVDNILDSEVYLVGEYKGTQIFVEYTDVRPFERLYARFARNKYRPFEKKTHD